MSVESYFMADIPNPFGPEQLVSVEDVQNELNYIEALQSEITGTDEYLEAVLQNTRVQAMWMMQNSQDATTTGPLPQDVEVDDDGSPSGYKTDVQPVEPDELTAQRYLPLSAVGIVNQRIYGNSTGEATVQINGTVRAETVKSTEDVARGDTVRVVAPGNIVEPRRDVADSLLGLGGGISVNTYQREETEEGGVDVAPGETETVLRVDLSNGSWVSVGTNDRQHTEYKYVVDNDNLNDDPLFEPLGLYNDPYQFPTPIAVDRFFEVRVKRTSSASSSATYYSKADYLS